MVADLTLVSSRSKQMEKMKDIALLVPLQKGVVVLKTISLYHLSRTFTNIN